MVASHMIAVSHGSLGLVHELIQSCPCHALSELAIAFYCELVDVWLACRYEHVTSFACHVEEQTLWCMLVVDGDVSKALPVAMIALLVAPVRVCAPHLCLDDVYDSTKRWDKRGLGLPYDLMNGLLEYPVRRRLELTQP